MLHLAVRTPLARKWPSHWLLRKGRRYGRHSSILATVLLPPLVFTGLLASLWTYKALMLVVFQNRIIYMPSMPPGARREKIEDFERDCSGVRWEQRDIAARDGTQLKLVISEEPGRPSGRVVILYFQGNGSSTPPRLPFLSRPLKMLRQGEDRPAYTFIALSYRGYWQSKGRPSYHGLIMDGEAAVEYISKNYPGASVFLWGQSIGTGLATHTAAAQYMRLPLRGVILETPFASMRLLINALYPEKWLPYRYLHPFACNHWNNLQPLKVMGSSPQGRRTRFLLLIGGRDELVPGWHGDLVEEEGRKQGLPLKKVVVSGALHSEVMTSRLAAKEIAAFVGRVDTERDGG